MAVIEVIRGDDYTQSRPLKTLTFEDAASDPLNLAGCTIRTTYKPVITPPETDPNDTTAEIRHFITFSGAGAVSDSEGFVLVGTAAGGQVNEYLTKTETMSITPDVELVNDVELTNAAGEVMTFTQVDTLMAVDAPTNRTTDA